MTVPRIQLNNGVEIPALGFGVFQTPPERTSTLQDPTIGKIAAAHGRTAAQVMSRWHLQQGRQAIPKSVTPARIAEDFDVFDFQLTPGELADIDALDSPS